MNLIDEDIPEDQRQLLCSWWIPVQQIGHDVGRLGMKDEAIIPLLHRIGPVTFFSRDGGFYKRHYREGLLNNITGLSAPVVALPPPNPCAGAPFALFSKWRTGTRVRQLGDVM